MSESYLDGYIRLIDVNLDDLEFLLKGLVYVPVSFTNKNRGIFGEAGYLAQEHNRIFLIHNAEGMSGYRASEELIRSFSPLKFCWCIAKKTDDTWRHVDPQSVFLNSRQLNKKPKMISTKKKIDAIIIGRNK